MRLLLSNLFVGVPLVIIGYIQDKIALSRDFSDPIFKGLRDSGIYIFENKLSNAEIQALLDDFERLKKQNLVDKSGQLAGRIYSPGLLSPLMGIYASRIQDHASKFLNTSNVNIEISYYQESFPLNTEECVPGGELHVDDSKANLKYFIYLTDVSGEGGCFSCIPSTGSWRLKGSLIRGLMWELTKARKFLYGFLLRGERLIRDEIEIIGAAGTNFIVDTTTVHRAKPVIAGCRKVAVISFNRRLLPYGWRDI